MKLTTASDLNSNCHRKSETKSVILLVEDDPGSRYALAQILRHYGYDVMEGANGNEARSLLQKHEFDLVITDVQMPEQSGIVLAAQIRVKRPEMPILMISGHLTEQAGKLVSQGWAEFIHKPFEPATLILTVQRMLADLVGGERKVGSPDRCSTENENANPAPPHEL